MMDDYDWGDPNVAAAVAAHNERVRQRIAEGCVDDTSHRHRIG
jgi:hypothetical protein